MSDNEKQIPMDDNASKSDAADTQAETADVKSETAADQSVEKSTEKTISHPPVRKRSYVDGGAGPLAS